MEKKTYTTPEIEVIDLDNQPAILVVSNGAPKYYDDGEFN